MPNFIGTNALACWIAYVVELRCSDWSRFDGGDYSQNVGQRNLMIWIMTLVQGCQPANLLMLLSGYQKSLCMPSYVSSSVVSPCVVVSPILQAQFGWSYPSGNKTACIIDYRRDSPRKTKRPHEYYHVLPDH